MTTPYDLNLVRALSLATRGREDRAGVGSSSGAKIVFGTAQTRPNPHPVGAGSLCVAPNVESQDGEGGEGGGSANGAVTWVLYTCTSRGPTARTTGHRDVRGRGRAGIAPPGHRLGGWEGVKTLAA